MANKFQLINPAHQTVLFGLVEKATNADISTISDNLAKLIEQIRADIPEKRRISYGRYNVVKHMGLEMYTAMEKAGIDVFNFSSDIFDNLRHDHFVRSLAIQLISVYGLETKDLEKVLPKFEAAAADSSWEVRECASGFVRKLTKMYPTEMHQWYLTMVKSKDSQQRRFSSESLRPVADNRWIRKQPEFAFSIIKHLYTEPDSYPKTSVGNNLSDWMRIDEDRTYRIVEKLAKNGNKNSYWIAYRACRNLVKIKPVEVMSLLGVEEYKYKDRVYHRCEYNGC
jgi:3-methyladenine DNA glycosylase AlkC